MRRFAYNRSLERRKEHYALTGKTLPLKTLSAELTALKSEPDTAWMKELASQVPQQALVDLNRAFVNFFEGRCRFPKFKSRKQPKQTFRIPQRVRVEGNEVIVPKVGRIRFKKSREIEGTIKSATFKRDARGHWYVSFTCRTVIPDIEPPVSTPERVVGVDVGLSCFAVRSDGARTPNPRFFRNDERKLVREQRKLCRRKRGSNRYHKHTTELIRSQEAVIIEDLNVRALARTKLGKSFSDAALGEWRRQLKYKAEWYGKRLVVVSRWFPSTKTCSVCGTIAAALTLSDRRWVCDGCGTVHDRDGNAAKNIRAEGLRLLGIFVQDSKTVAEGHPDTLNARGG